MRPGSPHALQKCDLVPHVTIRAHECVGVPATLSQECLGHAVLLACLEVYPVLVASVDLHT
jgi:hypothetical protein